MNAASSRTSAATRLPGWMPWDDEAGLDREASPGWQIATSATAACSCATTSLAAPDARTWGCGRWGCGAALWSPRGGGGLDARHHRRSQLRRSCMALTAGVSGRSVGRGDGAADRDPGSLEAHVNGALVCEPAGKQRALLTLLTVRAPHPVSAESVAESLWPRAAPAEAMRRLRVTASRRGARSVTPVRYWRRWRRDIGWR
jgi:hypothetical protein